MLAAPDPQDLAPSRNSTEVLVLPDNDTPAVEQSGPHHSSADAARSRQQDGSHAIDTVTLVDLSPADSPCADPESAQPRLTLGRVTDEDETTTAHNTAPRLSQAGDPQDAVSQAGDPQAGDPRDAASQAGDPQDAVSQAGDPQDAVSQAGDPHAGDPQGDIPDTTPAGQAAPRSSAEPQDAADPTREQQTPQAAETPADAITEGATPAQRRPVTLPEARGLKARGVFVIMSAFAGIGTLLGFLVSGSAAIPMLAGWGLFFGSVLAAALSPRRLGWTAAWMPPLAMAAVIAVFGQVTFFGSMPTIARELAMIAANLTALAPAQLLSVLAATGILAAKRHLAG